MLEGNPLFDVDHTCLLPLSTASSTFCQRFISLTCAVSSDCCQMGVSLSASPPLLDLFMQCFSLMFVAGLII